MTTYSAVCQDDAFWNACDWTTSNGTVITSEAERDAYYASRDTSLQNWNDNRKRSLVDNEVCEILGPWTAAEQGKVDITGWTTSYLYRLTIVAVGVARHNGMSSNTAYRVEASSTYCLDFRVHFIQVHGIQAINTSDTTYCIRFDGYKEFIELYDCILEGGANTVYAEVANSYYGGYSFYNCLIKNASRCGIQVRNTATRPGYILNCTFYNCNTSDSSYCGGVYDNYGFSTVRNCISINPNSNQAFRFHANTVHDHNVSSDGTADGSGSLINKTAAETFIDAANGDFQLKTTSPARNAAAITEDMPRKDIKEVWRDQTPDIGAFEYDTGYVPKQQVEVKLTSIVEGSVAIVEKVSDGADIIPATIVGASGVLSANVDYTTDIQVVIKVRNASSTPKYKPYRSYGTITSSGLNVFVSQTPDLIAS